MIIYLSSYKIIHAAHIKSAHKKKDDTNHQNWESMLIVVYTHKPNDTINLNMQQSSNLHLIKS